MKEAVKAIDRFEESLAHEALRGGYDGVICGHIHHAEMRDIGGVTYMNTGDWVESCTALVEHPDGRFELLDWSRRSPPVPRPVAPAAGTPVPAFPVPAFPIAGPPGALAGREIAQQRSEPSRVRWTIRLDDGQVVRIVQNVSLGIGQRVAVSWRNGNPVIVG